MKNIVEMAKDSALGLDCFLWHLSVDVGKLLWTNGWTCFVSFNVIKW